MKAAVYTKYGAPDVVMIKDIAKPTPKPDEILVEVMASAINSGDWRARSLELPPGFGLLGRLIFGVFGPRQKVLGSELSGVVCAVGAKVKNFKLGDRVFAMTGAKFGGHAEYCVLKANGPVVEMPAGMDFETAAAISFGGSTALDFLVNKGGLEKGQHVLINGASGAVGSAMVQLAKAFGAKVTGVSSGANADLVRSLGADEMIDYQQEDFTKDGVFYDMIVDTVGTSNWAHAKGSLAENGKLLVVSGSFADLIRSGVSPKSGSKQLIGGVASESRDLLESLKNLIEAGKFSPLIDRVFALDNIVEAHAYVDTGRKKGSVVISVGL